MTTPPSTSASPGQAVGGVAGRIARRPAGHGRSRRTGQQHLPQPARQRYERRGAGHDRDGGPDRPTGRVWGTGRPHSGGGRYVRVAGWCRRRCCPGAGVRTRAVGMPRPSPCRQRQTASSGRPGAGLAPGSVPLPGGGPGTDAVPSSAPAAFAPAYYFLGGATCRAAGDAAGVGSDRATAGFQAPRRRWRRRRPVLVLLDEPDARRAPADDGRRPDPGVQPGLRTPRLPDPARAGQRAQLVWLDNAATTQKPQRGDRPADATSTSTRTPTSTAPRTRSRRARPTPTRARGRTVAGSSTRRRPRRSCSSAARPRGSTWSRRRWGARNIGAGRRDRHLAPRAPRQHRAVAAARAADGRDAARSIPVDDDGERDARRVPAAAGRRARSWSSFTAGVERARARSRRSREMIEIAHRHGALRARRRRAGGLAHARSTSRRSTATSSCSPATRCSARPASAPSTASARCSRTMPPWQGGGNMISDVTFERTQLPAAAVPVRGRHRQHRRRGRARRRARLRHAASACRAIARYEHELLDYATERLRAVPGLRLIGTAPHKAGVLSFVLDGHAPTEVGAGARRGGHRGPVGSPLRPADPAPVRPRGHRPAVAGLLQHLRRGRPASHRAGQDRRRGPEQPSRAGRLPQLTRALPAPRARAPRRRSAGGPMIESTSL